MRNDTSSLMLVTVEFLYCTPGFVFNRYRRGTAVGIGEKLEIAVPSREPVYQIIPPIAGIVPLCALLRRVRVQNNIGNPGIVKFPYGILMIAYKKSTCQLII